MNAEPVSPQSLQDLSVEVAVHVEIPDQNSSRIQLKVTEGGRVALLAHGSPTEIDVVNCVVDGDVGDVVLELSPVTENTTVTVGATPITQDGVINHSNVSWSFDESRKITLRFMVPRSHCDRNPRIWEFSGYGVTPAPLKVKVRITRIDSQRLDVITG